MPARAHGPTKPAGFCQFYKIIKMIIKSIKVFVEWKFIPASSQISRPGRGRIWLTVDWGR